MIPDQADPTPLGCDSGYAAKRARPASAGQAAPLGVLVTVTRAPKFDGRRARPRPRRTRSTVELQRRRRFGRDHLVGLDGQSSVSAAGLLRLDRPLPPTRQRVTAPAPSGRRTIVGLEWNPLERARAGAQSASAMCMYLLLAYLKFVMRLRWSLHQMLQVLQLNMFERRPLQDLFTTPSLPAPSGSQLSLTWS